jgi:hypothetical protein
MNNPTAQDRLPANLAALRQGLKELAAATTKEKPMATGEDVGGRIVPPISSADLRKKIV